MSATAKRLPPPVPIVDDVHVMFGFRYPSGALAPEGGDSEGGADSPFEDPREPTGRPGTRAPHFVLERDGEATPIHDLFGEDFVLLTGAEGGAWSDAAAAKNGWHLPAGMPIRFGTPS